MADGSKAIASKITRPAAQCSERPEVTCPRCEGMELIDCDLCTDDREGCPRCEGLGLMACPACEAPPNAPLPAAPCMPAPRPYGADSIASSARQYTASPAKKWSSVPLPGRQPERKGAAGCGERLRWARQRLGLSMAQLAATAGYSLQTLFVYERDESQSGPPLKTIEDLAQALGVRRSWLAFGQGSVDVQRSQSPTSERRAVNAMQEER